MSEPRARRRFLNPTDRRVLRYFRPHVGQLVFASVLATFASGVTASPIWILNHFGNSTLKSGDEEQVARFAIGLVLVVAAAAMAQYGQMFFLRVVGLRIVQRLRSELVRHYQYVSLDMFRDQKAGDLTSRVITDSSVIQVSVQTVVDGFVEPFRLFVLLASAILLAPRLALLAFIVLPLTVVSVRALNRAIRRYSARTQSGIGNAAGIITESIAGAREVRAYNLEEQQVARFEKVHDEALRMAVKGARATSAGPSIVIFIGAISGGIVLYVGGLMIIEGTLTLPTLLAFMAAIGICYEPIRRLARVYAQAAAISAGAERIFVMMDLKTSVPDSGRREAPETVETLTFDKVSFSYGDRRVLDDVSLEVKRGEVVALVGESGSGKTTLVSLVPRFYDVAAGAVRINGIDVRDMPLASLRSRIAVVSQDTFLFHDTVRENVRLGRLGATDAEIEEACKAANAHGFLSKLPMGYDTMLGERGIGLSGGQRQRIAIARAILRNAPILLLDEATSALDSESEDEVQRALQELMRDKATLVVAHRLSTIKDADRTVVLSEGRIVEVGSHRDLLDRGGEYRRLHDLQFGRSS